MTSVRRLVTPASVEKFDKFTHLLFLMSLFQNAATGTHWNIVAKKKAKYQQTMTLAEIYRAMRNGLETPK